jgi:cytochrome P450
MPATTRRGARLAGFVTALTETTDAMLDRWAPRVRTGTPLDVAADMSALTLGIVGCALFSRVLDTAADEVGEALTAALAIVNERAIRFLPSLVWRPPATNRRLQRAIGVLDRVVYDIIETRRRPGQQQSDLLAMLLVARDEETGAGMTDRQLRDEVMTFMLAGHETTAVVLTWPVSRAPSCECRSTPDETRPDQIVDTWRSLPAPPQSDGSRHGTAS